MFFTFWNVWFWQRWTTSKWHLWLNLQFLTSNFSAVTWHMHKMHLRFDYTFYKILNVHLLPVSLTVRVPDTKTVHVKLWKNNWISNFLYKNTRLISKFTDCVLPQLWHFEWLDWLLWCECLNWNRLLPFISVNKVRLKQASCTSI